MKKMQILYFIFIMLLMLPEKAHAYLDPGTGSMVVQILIACFATVVVFFKSILQGIKAIFTGKHHKVADEDDE